MKKSVFTFIFILFFSFIGKAQTLRFFEFSTTNCGHGNWQDTTFIASTSNQATIDSVLANMARPLNQRNFINGPIYYGNGGHNHNANHWFLWHFIPNQWNLVELAIELCDGCPYTDVDTDTAYWVGTVGQFCPWSGRPVREVLDPALPLNTLTPDEDVTFFPNPAKNEIVLTWTGLNKFNVSIYNSMGQELYSTSLFEHKNSLNISNLATGLYFLKISDTNKSTTKKLLKE